MTTYVVLLIGDENRWDASTAEERLATYGRHEEFSRQLAARGHTVTGGAELPHSRRTTQIRRVAGEAVVTEGPYAETVEQVGGFYLVDSDDLDDLIQVCGVLADGDGAIEIREALADPDLEELTATGQEAPA